VKFNPFRVENRWLKRLSTGLRLRYAQDASGYVKFNRIRGCRLNENEKNAKWKNVKSNSGPERFEIHIAVGELCKAQENLRNEKGKKNERP